MTRNEDANNTQYHENPNNCIKINKLRFDNDSKITMSNSIFNTKLDSEIQGPSERHGNINNNEYNNIQKT